MFLIGIWVLLYTLSILTLVFGINQLRLSRNEKKMAQIDEVTIVVPFRNEASNLGEFMRCLKEQSYQPAQWIFVNDHSSDGFERFFEDVEEYPIRLLHLPIEQEGKKHALRFGMDHVRTEYCITMDADVVFQKNYIKNLLLVPEAELIILPVRMTAEKWWQNFFTTEYRFTTMLNKGIAGWFRPVNCSGANLMIHLSSFEVIDDIEDHEHILSGDDIYTLRAFRMDNKRIEILENQALEVETKTPDSFQEAMDQRVRWMSKSAHVADQLNNFLGIWAVGLHMYYLLLLLFSFFTGIYWLTILLIVFKGGLDLLLIVTDTKQNKPKDYLGLLLFEVWYPFYLFALLGFLMLSQPDWKGRS